MYGAIDYSLPDCGAILYVVQVDNHKNDGAIACMFCKMNSVDHKDCCAMLCNTDESEVGDKLPGIV